MSTAAAFVMTEQKLPVGFTLSLELLLPPLDPLNPGISMKSDGSVVRIEQVGFAVLIDLKANFNGLAGRKFDMME